MKAEVEATHWEVVGDGGTVKSRAFCPTCGSPVYLTFPGIPEIFIVHAGSLDDPTRYKPQMVRLAPPAVRPGTHLDPTLQKFDRMTPR